MSARAPPIDGPSSDPKRPTTCDKVQSPLKGAIGTEHELCGHDQRFCKVPNCCTSATTRPLNLHLCIEKFQAAESPPDGTSFD